MNKKLQSLFALPFSRANNDQAEMNRISALQHGTNVQILCQIQCLKFKVNLKIGSMNLSPKCLLKLLGSHYKKSPKKSVNGPSWPERKISQKVCYLLQFTRVKNLPKSLLKLLGSHYKKSPKKSVIGPSWPERKNLPKSLLLALVNQSEKSPKKSAKASRQSPCALPRSLAGWI